MTADVPHDEHERNVGRAAPAHVGPPSQELPMAGTGDLSQIAASATPPNSPPATVARGEGFYRSPNTAFDQPGIIRIGAQG